MSTAQPLVKTEEKAMEFIPYGASDKIKLTVTIIKKLVAVKTKSGKTCGDEDAIKFMMMCQARRLNPFEGDAYLIGYDGRDGATFSLITAHQAFLKRAELNAEYDGMKSGIIVEQDGQMTDLEGDFYVEGTQKVVGGWATVYFKNRKQPMHKRVRLKRFQKTWGIWQDDPAGMICKCAEADALRSSFPTMLGGLYLKEELQTQPEVKVSSPIFTEPAKPETPVVDVDSEPESPAAEAMGEPVAPPPKPDEKNYNIVKAVKGFFELAGIKPEQVVHFLKQLGSIGDNTNTLEEIAIQEPDVMTLLHDNYEDIIKKIKGQK